MRSAMTDGAHLSEVAYVPGWTDTVVVVVLPVCVTKTSTERRPLRFANEPGREGRSRKRGEALEHRGRSLGVDVEPGRRRGSGARPARGSSPAAGRKPSRWSARGRRRPARSRGRPLRTPRRSAGHRRSSPASPAARSDPTRAPHGAAARSVPPSATSVSVGIGTPAPTYSTAFPGVALATSSRRRPKARSTSGAYGTARN